MSVLAAQKSEERGKERFGGQWTYDTKKTRERERERETDRQTDRQTERQRDRDTERQRDRETERQRDRETERDVDKKAVLCLGLKPPPTKLYTYFGRWRGGLSTNHLMNNECLKRG